jgi:anti-sigma factor RsiW
MAVIERVRGLLECRRVARRLQAYLDGELPVTDAATIADHLEVCRHCGMEADTYQALKDGLAALDVPPDPSALQRLARFADELDASAS